MGPGRYKPEHTGNGLDLTKLSLDAVENFRTYFSPFLGAPVAAQVLQQGELSQLLPDPLQTKWNSCLGTLGI